jgi:hypothetical protein
LKQIALAIVILALSTFVLYAAVRETGKQPSAAPSADAAFSAGLAMGEHSRLRALTPEEEAYAAALWPIHSEVKLAAMRMTFAGLNYKIEHQDPAKVKSTVQPLTEAFQSAVQRAGGLQPPESLQDAHATYLDALGLYAEAAREMIKIADDGRDQHLVAAHERSERASHALLQLSDVLWPGEYKPN